MAIITRRQLLEIAAVAPQIHISRADARKTNVVFFLTDDHGAWAMSSNCSTLHTPNLKRLAAEGTSFTRAYACTPVCSPSRMTYFTGKLPSHHGVQDWLQDNDSYGPETRRFLSGHLTFSEVLANHGYTLGHCGKWHMGDDEHAQAGFTYWSTVPGSGSPYKDAEFVKNGNRVRTKGFKEDFVRNDALEFLELHKDRPFFLYVALAAPHGPYDYQPEEYRKWYANSTFPCFPDEPIHPWHLRKTKSGRPYFALNDFGNWESKLSYSALVSSADDNVGRIVRRLDELGLRENTLVIFTADQGHNCGHHGIWGKGNSTMPFNMYEESLHIPLIWNHPGQIESGRLLSPIVSAYDFFPTILDYLHIQVPKDPERVGHSYAPFLRGQELPWQNEVFFEYCYVRGIRTENLKYIERTSEWPNELFDLEEDPGEKRNVVENPRHARQLEALRARLSRFFEQARTPKLDRWRSTTDQDLPVYVR